MIKQAVRHWRNRKQDIGQEEGGVCVCVCVRERERERERE